jgi:hypothetical protein
MQIRAFDPLLSDIHNPVVFTLNCAEVSKTPTGEILEDGTSMPKRPKWDAEIKKRFAEKISEVNVVSLTSQLDNMLSNANGLNLEDVDKVTESVNNILTGIAKEIGSIKEPIANHKTDSVRKVNKPWFDRNCKIKRGSYFTAKKRYKNVKTTQAKNDMSIAARDYKREINKQYRLFHDQMNRKLRGLKNKDPKAYWSILGKDKHAKKQEMDKISKQVLYEHFSKLNKDNSDPEEIDYTNVDVNPENVEINQPFTAEEVIKAVKKLKTDKACGLDLIINEFLTASVAVMSNVYVKLFNIVLNTGTVPTEWTKGVISSIYKNKGSINDPDNYRGITVLSCLGKLFTACINKRLYDYIECYGVLNENQTGFRKGYSTVDHLFVLQGIIELYLS